MKHSSVVESLTGILSEDDLEKFAGEDERAKYILTEKMLMPLRNVKDYKEKNVVIQTAEEYIKTVGRIK